MARIVESQSPFRIRIIEHLVVPAEEIAFAPLNPRRHPAEQTAAVGRSLERLGWLDEVKVWRRPDGVLQLIDGEDRTRIAAGQMVPVAVLDLDEHEADEALATYDATTYLAQYNDERAHLLAERVELHSAHSAALLRVVAERDLSRELLDRYRDELLLGGWGDADTDSDTDGNEDDQDDDDEWFGDGEPYHEDSTSDNDGTETLWDRDEDDEDEDDDNEEAHAGSAEQDDDDTPASAPVFDREQVIDTAFAHYRAQGFPYRALPTYTCMQRINKLSRLPEERLLRTSVGGDVADTYHPHRFHAAAAGMKSPFEAFHDDKLLRHVIELRYDGVGAIEQGYLPAMSVVTGTQACYNFRPGFATAIYKRYCQPGDTVLDTSTGYGGRLLGFFASGVWREGGKYVGIDPNTLTYAGNGRMAVDFGLTGSVELWNAPAEDITPEMIGVERCDFAFTSPPYFTRERYSEEETQSWKRYGHDRTGEAWRKGFLEPMLRLQFALLKLGAYSLINVDDVNVDGQAYPLVHWTTTAAIAAGFDVIGMDTFTSASSSLGAGHDPSEAGKEPVLVLRKPGGDRPQSGPIAVSELEPLPHIPSPAAERPAPIGRSLPAITGPMRLADWMRRLYVATADLVAFRGDLGVWPEEMREFLELTCLAHSTGHIRFRVAPGLLTTEDTNAKEQRSDTCALFFSGGKDSVAMGVQAARDGWRVHAIHVRDVNKAYRHELTAARHIAKAMGWAFNVVGARKLPPIRTPVSVIREFFCAALVLQRLPYIPGAIAFGNYGVADGGLVPWLSGMEPAFRVFDQVLRAAYGDEAAPKRLTPLNDEIAVLGIWREQSQTIKDLTSSCTTLPHNRVLHRRRLQAEHVPLDAQDCGVCEKCRVKAVVLALHYDQVYPSTYFAECQNYLKRVLPRAAEWSHAHPRLMLPPGEGRSVAELSTLVLGLEEAVEQAPKPAAYEPLVRRIEHWERDASASAMASNNAQPGSAPVLPLEQRAPLAPAFTLDMPHAFTPFERHGPVWMKREDLFVTDGVNGAVARDVQSVLTQWKQESDLYGITTSGGIHSSQIVAAAAIGNALGLDVQVFVPAYKAPSREIERALNLGAAVIGVQMGYPRTVAKRAKEAVDALIRESNGQHAWRYLPYAHQVRAAVVNSAAQVANIPLDAGITRIITAVGNGMTTCGVATGLAERGITTIRVLGVVVGSMRSAQENLQQFCRPEAQALVTLVDGTKGHAGAHERHKQTHWYGVDLDPYFEAVAAAWLEPGDCLWIMSNSDTVTAGDESIAQE